MDWTLMAVVAVIGLALLFDFSNGFHDAANSVATVVATRVMPARWAVWFSAVCNFAAFFLVGTAVANTVAKTVDPSTEGISVIFSALVAAIAWNYATWYIGMPSSSSHALIGGLIGAGLAAGGTDAINWGSVKKTMIAIVASPAVAFSVAAVAVVLVWAIKKVTRWSDDAKPFKGLQLVSAAAVSVGHGANDAQKTMGVIAVLLASGGYLGAGADAENLPVPKWVALLAYGAIAVGTVWGGWRIIETMGLKITKLNARVGVAANIGATAAIFGATQMGIPISTTHAAASSVVGAGTAARRGTRWDVVRRMVVAWLVTIPATTALSFLMWELTALPKPLAVPLVGGVVIGLGGWIIHAMRGSLGHREVQEAVAQAQEAAEVSPTPVGSTAA